MNKLLEIHNRYKSVIVWSLRIIVGATFIISGVAKFIDLWGFIYKIEQYFRLWGIPDLRSVIFLIAFFLSSLEFVGGLMLATGSYKRSCVIGLSALMAVMLPLSGYLWLYNPIEDCGCFGDFWVISNWATFVKNLFLTLALIYLCRFNKSVKGLYNQYTQWIQVVLCVSYSLFVGLIGYNIQPLIDFRGYKVGEMLIDETDIPEVLFVYEKEGVRQEFSAYNLPDSTWSYVERIENVTSKNEIKAFAIIDGDEDVTKDVVEEFGEQLLVLIPEVDRADISYTYIINEINRYIESRQGSMVGLIATNEHGLEYWRDISMADYELYSAEDTEVKEIARGHISMVYLKDGVIQWKRTLSSIDEDLFTSNQSEDPLNELYFDGKVWFWILTGVHSGLMVILLIFDALGLLVSRRIYRKNEKKELTLQKEKQ